MNQVIEANPYVGTRPFETKDKDFFFGRERGIGLLSLVISARLVLFYAQSGAGKSSLINTRLIPGLIGREEYKVLPVGRLLGEFNQIAEANNIYTYNLITSLLKQKLNETLVSKLTLSQFLAGLDYDDDQGYFYNESLPEQSIESEDERGWKVVLIIDQFEELFTTHQEQWRKREDFFKQLTQAIEDFPNLWIVLVMREDYVAALDSYAYLVPGNFRSRYYMQRLGHLAAIEAVQGPAAKKNRPFIDEVAEKLVKDLSGIKVRKPDNTLETQAGQYVEPVQLQVVCFSLWEKLPPDCTQITQEHLDQYVGNVNQALGNYYKERVKAVSDGEIAKQNRVKERDIREWFGRKLITADGIRNMVAQERDGESGELDDDVVQEFVKRGDLVRAEQRGGATFYELTHDRMIEPIIENNLEWDRENRSPFRAQADEWEKKGRTDNYLISDQALVDAEQWSEKHPDELTELEMEFLEACREQQAMLQRKLEEQVQSDRRLRRFVAVVSVLALLAVIAAVAAFFFGAQAQAATTEANNSLNVASTEKAKAQAASTIAVEKSNDAATAQANAELQANKALSSSLAAQAESIKNSDHALALLLGLEAYQHENNLLTRTTLFQLLQYSPFTRLFGFNGADRHAVSPTEWIHIKFHQIRYSIQNAPDCILIHLKV
jgi:hypothetical protein